MSRVFVSMLRYKKIRDIEIQDIKKTLGLEDWEAPLPPGAKELFRGFHPMVEVSLCALLAEMPQTTISVVDGDADIAKGRATNVGIFKKMWDEGKKHDFYLVLDDDIEFKPEAVKRLIDNDKDVSHGIYTFKSNVCTRRGLPTCKFYKEEMGDLNTPFKIQWAAGGFILLKSHVVLKMIEKYSDLKYQLPKPSNYVDGEFAGSAWDLWQQFIIEENGIRMRLQEDYAFSQRIHEIGYDIWADWRVKLTHWDGVDGYGFTPVEEDSLKERKEENAVSTMY
jgi:hypothetical protein